MPPYPFRADCIDVHEGESVDWKRIAEQGVSIGIVKADENGFRRDAAFHTNWPAMRDAGLIRGAYQFYNPRPVVANNVAQNRANAEAACDEFIQIVRDAGGLEPGDLPLIFDLENDRGVPQDDLLNQVVWWLAHCRDVMRRDMGRNDIVPMIYSGHFWRDNLGNPTEHTTPDGITLHFRDFPFWLADYPLDQEVSPNNSNCAQKNTCDPDDAAALAAAAFANNLERTPRVPAAWWESPWILWQYTHCARMDGVPDSPQGLDCSVIVTLTPRRDANGQVNGATMQKSTDLRPLLELAGVAPPRQPREVTRVRGFSDRPPEETFNLLVVGQGFWPREIDAIVDQMIHGARMAGPWGVQVPTVGVLDVPPLNLLAQQQFARQVAIYRDAGGGNPNAAGGGTEGTCLCLQQKDVAPGLSPQLMLPTVGVQPPQVSPGLLTLEQYLGSLRVRKPDGTLVEANTVWRPRHRRTGVTGTLVVVLRKAQFTWIAGAPDDVPTAPTEGELYQLDPSEDSPVPFVAVNVVPGGIWPLVVARAIAQNLAALADEFELEGDLFAKPPEGAREPDSPNLVYFDDARRARLAGGEKAQTVLPQLSVLWNVPANAAVDFVAHDGDAPNSLPRWNGVDPAPGAGFHLVEGGDGYRRNVARCDRDCLMRRVPSTIAAAMKAAPSLPIQSDLHAFCKACEHAIREALAGQSDFHIGPRVDLDNQRILFDWISWTSVETLALNTVTLTAPDRLPGPRWTGTLDFSNNDFKLTDLQLANPAYWDPAAAAQVARVLKSIVFSMQVTFGDGTTRPLAVSAGLSPALRPPPRMAPDPKLLVARQADAAGDYQLGARLSLSWKVQDGAGRFCIVDGVLSLVLRGISVDGDPAGLVTGCKIYPQIALRYRRPDKNLSVKSFQANIVMTANNADGTGLAGPLKAIANGKLAVSAFAESNAAGRDSHFNPEILVYDNAPPYHQIATVKPGRKLATVRGPILNWAVKRLFPPLHWSWLYDYTNLLMTGNKPLLAVHALSEAGFGAVRDRAKVWPPGQADFQSGIHKLPRQGAYDGLCIHPEQTDSANQPLAEAPWSADLAITLFWRHGLSRTGAPSVVVRSAGWGSGRLDQGAYSLLGAPLCPPNQRIDVQVNRAADGSTVIVTYSARIGQPRLACWQVVLERGLNFGLAYTLTGPLRAQALAWLSASTGADPDFDAAAARISAKLADRVQLDAETRATMRKIFQAGRRFDAALDGFDTEQVPPGPGDAANLENL